MSNAATGDALYPWITLAVVVAVFFICRAVVLWYWRVNHAINLLTEINDKLGRILEQRSTDLPTLPEDSTAIRARR